VAIKYGTLFSDFPFVFVAETESSYCKRETGILNTCYLNFLLQQEISRQQSGNIN
jgi:hypothetical protein